MHIYREKSITTLKLFLYKVYAIGKNCDAVDKLKGDNSPLLQCLHGDAYGGASSSSSSSCASSPHLHRYRRGQAGDVGVGIQF